MCAIVGDADHCAPHREIRECFDRYPGAHVDDSTGVHVIPHQTHVVSDASVDIGLRFLRRCLASAEEHEQAGLREQQPSPTAAGGGQPGPVSM